MEQKVNYNVDVPVFNEESDVKSILEWLGALNLQCKMYAM